MSNKQKGFAVISGSNTVVAKIMESGEVAFGGAARPVSMSISGSLTFGGLSGSAEGVTTGGADKVLLVGAGGVATIAQLDANQITSDFPGSNSTVSGALAALSSSLANAITDLGGVLTVSASNGTQEIDLSEGELKFEGSDANIDITKAVNGQGAKITVSLNTNLSASSLQVTEIKGPDGNVAITLSSAGDATVAGDLDAVSGSFSGDLDAVSGSFSGDVSAVNATLTGDLDAVDGTFTGNVSAVDATLTGDLSAVDGAFSGDLTVEGNLTIRGTTTTIDTTNLNVEDSIVQLGSGSSGNADGDRGLIFSLSSQNQAIIWDDSDSSFKLGETSQSSNDTTITIDALGTLKVGDLHATSLSGIDSSGAASALTIGLPDQDLTLSGDSIVISGSTAINVTGAVNLGETAAASQIVSVNSRFRVPRLTRAQAQDQIYTSANNSVYNGEMFYLDDADGVNADKFPQGQKWYFCEDGEWHASPFLSIA